MQTAITVWLLATLSVTAFAARPSASNERWNLNECTLPLRQGDVSSVCVRGSWPGHKYTRSPDNHLDLRIYHLMTDRFAVDPEKAPGREWDQHCRPISESHGGTWREAKQRIRYVAEMGFNTVLLSAPFWNAHDAAYHYYWPVDLTLLDPRQGTLQELRELVDECHRLGLYVMVDYIYNHLSRPVDASAESFNPDGVLTYEIDWIHDTTVPDPYGWMDSVDLQVNNTLCDGHSDPARPDKLRTLLRSMRLEERFPDQNGTRYCHSDFHHWVIDDTVAHGHNIFIEHYYPTYTLGRIFKDRTIDVRTESEYVQEVIVQSLQALFAAADIDGVRIDAALHVESDTHDRIRSRVSAWLKQHLGKENPIFLYEYIFQKMYLYNVRTLSTIRAFTTLHHNEYGLAPAMAYFNMLRSCLLASNRTYTRACVEDMFDFFRQEWADEKTIVPLVMPINTHDGDLPSYQHDPVTALTLLFTLPSVVYVFQGLEQSMVPNRALHSGHDLRPSMIGTLAERARLGHPPCRNCFDMLSQGYGSMQTWNQIRKALPALRYGSADFLPHPNKLIYSRTYREQRVAVVLDVSEPGAAQDGHPSLLVNDTWLCPSHTRWTRGLWDNASAEWQWYEHEPLSAEVFSSYARGVHLVLCGSHVPVPLETAGGRYASGRELVASVYPRHDQLLLASDGPVWPRLQATARAAELGVMWSCRLGHTGALQPAKPSDNSTWICPLFVAEHLPGAHGVVQWWNHNRLVARLDIERRATRPKPGKKQQVPIELKNHNIQSVCLFSEQISGSEWKTCGAFHQEDGRWHFGLQHLPFPNSSLVECPLSHLVAVLSHVRVELESGGFADYYVQDRVPGTDRYLMQRHMVRSLLQVKIEKELWSSTVLTWDPRNFELELFLEGHQPVLRFSEQGNDTIFIRNSMWGWKAVPLRLNETLVLYNPYLRTAHMQWKVDRNDRWVHSWGECPGGGALDDGGRYLCITEFHNVYTALLPGHRLEWRFEFIPEYRQLRHYTRLLRKVPSPRLQRPKRRPGRYGTDIWWDPYHDDPRDHWLPELPRNVTILPSTHCFYWDLIDGRDRSTFVRASVADRTWSMVPPSQHQRVEVRRLYDTGYLPPPDEPRWRAFLWDVLQPQLLDLDEEWPSELHWLVSSDAWGWGHRVAPNGTYRMWYLAQTHHVVWRLHPGALPQQPYATGEFDTDLEQSDTFRSNLNLVGSADGQSHRKAWPFETMKLPVTTGQSPLCGVVGDLSLRLDGWSFKTAFSLPWNGTWLLRGQFNDWKPNLALPALVWLYGDYMLDSGSIRQAYNQSWRSPFGTWKQNVSWTMWDGNPYTRGPVPEMVHVDVACTRAGPRLQVVSADVKVWPAHLDVLFAGQPRQRRKLVRQPDGTYEGCWHASETTYESHFVLAMPHADWVWGRAINTSSTRAVMNGLPWQLHTNATHPWICVNWNPERSADPAFHIVCDLWSGSALIVLLGVCAVGMVVQYYLKDTPAPQGMQQECIQHRYLHWSEECTVTHVSLEYNLTLDHDQDRVLESYGGLGLVVDLMIHSGPMPVLLIAPLYRTAKRQLAGEHATMLGQDWELEAPILFGGGSVTVAFRQYQAKDGRFGSSEQRQVRLCLIECAQEWSSYDAAQVYQADSALEFQRRLWLWNKCVVEAARRLGDEMPGLLHLHDYHSMPACRELTLEHPELRVVFTLHNAHYRGECWVGGQAPDAWYDAWGCGGGADVVEDQYMVWLKWAADFCCKHQEGLGMAAVSEGYARQIRSVFYATLGQPGLQLQGIPNPYPIARDRLPFRGKLQHDRAKRELQQVFGLEQRKDARVLLVLGRVVHMKGVDLLQEAYASLPRGQRLQVLVMGPPGDETGLGTLDCWRSLADELPGQIAIVGEMVRDRRKQVALAGADFMACFSRYEPFGYTDFEGAQHSVPTVGFCTGGLGKVPGLYEHVATQWEEERSTLVDKIRRALFRVDSITEPEYQRLSRQAWEYTSEASVEQHNLLCWTHYSWLWKQVGALPPSPGDELVARPSAETKRRQQEPEPWIQANHWQWELQHQSRNTPAWEMVRLDQYYFLVLMPALMSLTLACLWQHASEPLHWQYLACAVLLTVGTLLAQRVNEWTPSGTAKRWHVLGCFTLVHIRWAAAWPSFVAWCTMSLFVTRFACPVSTGDESFYRPALMHWTQALVATLSLGLGLVLPAMWLQVAVCVVLHGLGMYWVMKQDAWTIGFGQCRWRWPWCFHRDMLPWIYAQALDTGMYMLVYRVCSAMPVDEQPELQFLACTVLALCALRVWFSLGRPSSQFAPWCVWALAPSSKPLLACCIALTIARSGVEQCQVVHRFLRSERFVLHLIGLCVQAGIVSAFARWELPVMQPWELVLVPSALFLTEFVRKY